MQDEVIGIYESEAEINNILKFLREYSFDDLIKTDHFLYSLDEKGTNIKLLEERFKDFEKVKLVVKREHKTNGKTSYDFYYKLSEQLYLMYAINFEGEKPVLINAFQVDRSFERFRNWIVNAYK